MVESPALGDAALAALIAKLDREWAATDWQRVAEVEQAYNALRHPRRKRKPAREPVRPWWNRD